MAFEIAGFTTCLAFATGGIQRSFPVIDGSSFYKQHIYKQRGLKSDFAKQMSIHNSPI